MKIVPVKENTMALKHSEFTPEKCQLQLYRDSVFHHEMSKGEKESGDTVLARGREAGSLWGVHVGTTSMEDKLARPQNL